MKIKTAHFKIFQSEYEDVTERMLFLSPEVRKVLHPAQLDAVELAGLDCFFVSLDSDFKPDLIHELSSNQMNVALCTSKEYSTLMHLQAAQGTVELPKSIIVLNPGEEKHDPFAGGKYRPRICYTVGATTPVLLRGLIGSILEFQIGIGHRGILPRIATSQGFEIERRILRSSSERSSMQQFVSDFIKNTIR